MQPTAKARTGRTGLQEHMMQWVNEQRAWAASLIKDREIFMRTDGEIKFIRLSARLQKRAAAIVGAALLLWLVITLGMAGYQLFTAGDRAAVASREAAVKAREAKVKAYQSQFANEAERLDARQSQLEEMFEKHFGSDPAAIAPDNGGSASAAASDADSPAPGVKDAGKDAGYVATPDQSASTLSAVDQRQRRFASRLMAAVDARAARAEQAIRALGINPDAIGEDGVAVGGPFIPMAQPRSRVAKIMRDPALDALAEKLDRMERLERSLLAMPLSSPAASMLMSSGYGYRHDPFTGAGAFHAGLDFKGPIGTPIYAASNGRVSFVGVQSGYGNTVEIDHGHGIITRYAHLSGFDVTLGAVVGAGSQIARMGNSGRSTGPHLHFEVRINGSAVDPRRFLEANQDVLKIKANAGRRLSAIVRSF